MHIKLTRRDYPAFARHTAVAMVSLKRKELAAAGEPPDGLSPKGPSKGSFKQLTGPMIVH
jgi:hypothetical protein